MKNTSLLLVILFIAASTYAQGVFKNKVNTALEKVVQDYPSRFTNIKGELLSSRQGAAEFKSTIAIPGALSTSITQQENNQHPSVTWQSVLFTSTEFGQARTQFEEFFNQIKNTVIRAPGEKAVIVNGLYIDPSADKNFTTVQFDLLPPSGLMQKLNIDLVLESNGSQWQVLLTVSDKERKDGGAIVVK